jgi:hypothetical protein
MTVIFDNRGFFNITFLCMGVAGMTLLAAYAVFAAGRHGINASFYIMIFGNMTIDARHFSSGGRHVNINIAGIRLNKRLIQISAKYTASLSV